MHLRSLEVALLWPVFQRKWVNSNHRAAQSRCWEFTPQHWLVYVMTLRLKIISAAIRVVEPCADVTTGGRGEITQGLFIVRNSLRQTHLNWRVCCSLPPSRLSHLFSSFLSTSASPEPKSEQCWLLIISKWSQLRFFYKFKSHLADKSLWAHRT